MQDPEVKKTKLAAELANGRLAMVAIIGILAPTFCLLHAIYYMSNSSSSVALETSRIQYR